jgi:hypothetical protein
MLVVTSEQADHAKSLFRASAICGKFNHFPLRNFLMRSSSRHQKNHTRPFKCQQCSLGFPTPKDLERHNNSVHTTTTKYFCPHDYCRDSLRPDQTSIITWGFRRKDHWQKHMRDEHQMNREDVRQLQKDGIPMAMLKDEEWVFIQEI